MKKRFWILILTALLLMVSALALTACGGKKTVAILTPADGAEGVDTMPEITWSSDDRADWYEVTISEHADFSDPAVNAGALTDTRFSVVTALKNDQTYYLRVRACADDYVNAATSVFKTRPFEAYPEPDLNRDVTVFDFDYADRDALLAEWTMHGGGDPFTPTLIDSPLPDGGKALRIEYDGTGAGKQGWAQFYAKVPNDKYIWDGRAGVGVYLESAGDGSLFRVLIQERLDEYWYADVKMNAAYRGVVQIPFSAFLPSPDGYGNRILELRAIKQAAVCSIGDTKGSFVVDDFRILVECEDNRALFESTDSPDFVPALDYESFDAYTDGRELGDTPNGSWKAGSAEPMDQSLFELVDDGAGGKALSVPKTATQIIHTPNKINWAALGGMEFRAGTTEGATTVYVQIADNADRYAQTTVAIDERFRTFRLNFADFAGLVGGQIANLGDVRFLKFYIANNYDQGSVVIDDLKFSEDPYELDDSVLLYDDFAFYADTAALQKAWTQLPDEANGNPTLAVRNDVPVMRIAGGTARVLADMGGSLSKYNAVRITYYALTAYDLEIAMWIDGTADGNGDFSGKLPLAACGSDTFAEAVLRIGGGGTTTIGNLQLKSIGIDTDIAKIEFVEDDSAPPLGYTATTDSITVTAVRGAEYSVDGGETWSADPKFTGLIAGNLYEIAIRYAAANGFAASKIAKKTVTLTSFTLGAPFADRMVLQRGMAVPVWGSGVAGTEYTLTFDGQTVRSTADANGRFSFELAAMEANRIGQTLTVTDGNSSLTLRDVLVGEVWIAAGQSNMQFTLATADYTPQDLAQTDGGAIRLFFQDMATADAPKTQFVNGYWAVADSSSALSFSAIGYLYAAALYEKLGGEVPVGVVYAAQGGTDIEAWISDRNYTGDKATRHGDYNAMIAPMGGMAAQGVLWYQGENNASEAFRYAELLRALVRDWRETFANPELYFAVIQLPKYNAGNVNWAYLREAQAEAVAATEGADLIVTVDGGDLTNIHPTQKRYIASRCVDMAAYRLYGGAAVAYPVYERISVSGDTATVTFANAAGLYADGAAAEGFELAGEDGEFRPATATVDGETAVLRADGVAAPVYVRYNFVSVGGGNLYNGAGLPLTPFRTDRLARATADDFSAYETTEALERFWEAYESSLELIDTPTGKGMKVTGAAQAVNPQAALALGQDWSAYRSVKIVYMTEANGATFDFVLNIGGKYIYTSITGNGKWQTAVVSIAALSGDIADYTGYVAYVNIKPNPGSGHWVAVDSISVVEEDKTQLPGADPVDLTLYDFDDYADDAAIATYWQPNGVGTASLTAGERTGKAMKVVGKVFNYTTFRDWGKHGYLSIRYRAAGGMTVQLDDGTGKYPYAAFGGDGSWQTAVISLERFASANLSDITVIFLSADGGTAEIDEIMLTVEGEENLPTDPPAAEDCVLYDFEDYADDAALKTYWQREGVSGTVALTEGENGGHAMRVTAGQVFDYVAVKDWSAYAYLSVRYRATVGAASFTIQLSDGAIYPYVAVNADGGWQTVTVALSRFLQDGVPLDCASVTTFYFNATDELIVDEITLLIDGTESMPPAPDESDTFRMFTDFDTDAWVNGILETVDGYTVLTPQLDGGYYFQAENGSTPSSNSFANVKAVKVRFKAAAGVKIKVLLSDWGSNFASYELTGTGDWAELAFNLADMTGAYDFGWVACLQFSNFDPNLFYVDWIKISDTAIGETDPFRSFFTDFDADAVSGWEHGTLETVDGCSVYTATEENGGYYFQAVNSSAPSSNSFANVKAVKVRFKAASGAEIKMAFDNWASGDAHRSAEYVLVGTGDWTEVAFDLADMTGGDTFDFGWVPCLQFSNWSGYVFSVDYIMTSDTEIATRNL